MFFYELFASLFISNQAFIRRSCSGSFQIGFDPEGRVIALRQVLGHKAHENVRDHARYLWNDLARRYGVLGKMAVNQFGGIVRVER